MDELNQQLELVRGDKQELEVSSKAALEHLEQEHQLRLEQELEKEKVSPSPLFHH
jgi:hypothetical protein